MIKRATCKTWAEYFEKHEGVRVDIGTIRRRLMEAGRIGESARSKVGRLLVGSYYSEEDVRQACSDLLHPLPQAGESDFFVRDDIRHGTVKAWSHQLDISENAVRSRLLISKAPSVMGRSRQGNFREYYPEPAVRSACADLLATMPVAGESGFFLQGGVRHGTSKAWSRELRISDFTIHTHLRLASVPSVEGRSDSGAVCDFYPEPAVRDACADLLDSLNLADKDGFLTVNGVLHGCVIALARLLGIGQTTILSRIVKSDIVPVRGKLKSGHVQDFYPEPAVRSACADLLAPMPVAGESGFFKIDGLRYSTIGRWSRELGVSQNAVSSRIISNFIPSVQGKDSGGRIQRFYPEPAVREACADLLAKRKK